MGYCGNLERKNLIQKLRQEGYSYREIEKITKASKKLQTQCLFIIERYLTGLKK